MSIGLLRWYTPKATFRRTANHRLHEYFPEKSAQVWRSTRTWQTRLAASRPRYSASVNLMIRYAEWCCALYRALQDHGMSQAEAGMIVEQVMSDAYRPVPAAMFRLSRLRSSKHDTRVKWLMSLITQYFFSSPFHHRHLSWETGVAFDVTICPFADYFRDQGVPELTPYAACNADHIAAHALGIKLIRTQTITGGAEYCDFRWEIPKQF